MKKAFISYAKEDIGYANEISDFLHSRGIDIWLDIKKLLPGQNWKTEIEKAINEADFFIACLSRNSVNKRGYVQKELKTALQVLDLIPEGNIYIIPIIFDDCEAPFSLKETVIPILMEQFRINLQFTQTFANLEPVMWF